MSRPTKQQLADWRVFLESAWALIDILDTELQSERKLTLVWYDALVHLEDATDGLGMTELANRILASKSGLTRVIDRMEADGLVRRERPPEDRRVVKVFAHTRRTQHAAKTHEPCTTAASRNTSSNTSPHPSSPRSRPHWKRSATMSGRCVPAESAASDQPTGSSRWPCAWRQPDVS